METTIATAIAVLRYWSQVTHTSQDPPAANVLRQLAGTQLHIQPELQSIFGRIEGNTRNGMSYLHPKPLALNTLFPSTKKPDPHTYATQRDTLATAAARIAATGDEHELIQLLFTLQYHGWALPSPLAAVSRYDFARMHAAIAAAQPDKDGNVFVLGGDLSGVQAFLYTLTAKQATRQLRGRSFYLQLLTDACAHYVLQHTAMPATNLLYSGGGRFYVVLPPTIHEDTLNELRRSIGSILLRAHRGELYLALGGARYGNAAEHTWKNVTEAINHDKRRRFATLPAEELHTLFRPQPPLLSRSEGGDDTTDESDDYSNKLPPLEQSLATLGNELPRVRYITRTHQPPPHKLRTTFARWEDVTAALGVQFTITDPVSDGTPHQVLALNDDAYLAATQKVPGTPVGMRYLVNTVPTLTEEDLKAYSPTRLKEIGQDTDRVGAPKTFGLLAEESEGFKRWAVLRMDVDDLGTIFGTRLNRDPGGLAGLAYTAALSGALSRFFEGWIGDYCKEKGIYAVYSGGDDLFLVGSWHQMPATAARIRNEFVRYTTGTPPTSDTAPPITISGGISLHTHRYPLYQAATTAHNALDRAKDMERVHNGRAKDALCFLDHVIAWEDYAHLDGERQNLQDLLAAGVPRGLLITLQTMYSNYRSLSTDRFARGSNTPQVAIGPWVWRGAYLLTRLAERTSNDATTQQIHDLRDRVTEHIQYPPAIISAAIAARWAQLLLRERSNEQ